MTETVARSLHPFAYTGPFRIYTKRDRRFLIAKNIDARYAILTIGLLRRLPHGDRRSHGVLMRLYKRALR
jgi:hypothetical protein